MSMATVSVVIALGMAIFWNVMRFKNASKPVKAKNIILPPIFMSTGACMYFIPTFRLTGSEILEGVIAGVICSYFLVKTSKMEIRDNQIYLKSSKMFIVIVAVLLIVRTGAKTYLSSTIDYGQLAGLFYLLALSMIGSWRIAMYFNYKKLEKQLQETQASL